MNVVLRLMDTAVEFLWWGGGVGFAQSFLCPNTVLRLCCVELSLGLRQQVNVRNHFQTPSARPKLGVHFNFM